MNKSKLLSKTLKFPKAKSIKRNQCSPYDVLETLGMLNLFVPPSPELTGLDAPIRSDMYLGI